MSRVLKRFFSLLWCGLLVIKRRIVESMDDNNIAVLISASGSQNNLLMLALWSTKLSAK